MATKMVATGRVAMATLFFRIVAFSVDCKTAHIFVYSITREQSNKRSGTSLKTESETGERR